VTDRLVSRHLDWDVTGGTPTDTPSPGRQRYDFMTTTDAQHITRLTPEQLERESPEKLSVAERNLRNERLSSYSQRPLAFLFRYIRRRPVAH